MSPSIQLAIFDLDGTLLNTVADLANATNYALAQCSFPTHPTGSYYKFVGNGINRLFYRALPENARTETNIKHIRDLFVPYYNIHNTDESVPYPGITTLLEHLQESGILIAIASNKYQQATENLIKHFFPQIQFAAILGQREGVPIKPDPTIINDILKVTGIKHDNTLYIGDSGVDMQTALNANVKSIGVTWGFRTKEELMAHDAKWIAHTANDIITIIETYTE